MTKESWPQTCPESEEMADKISFRSSFRSNFSRPLFRYVHVSTSPLSPKAQNTFSQLPSQSLPSCSRLLALMCRHTIARLTGLALHPFRPSVQVPVQPPLRLRRRPSGRIFRLSSSHQHSSNLSIRIPPLMTICCPQCFALLLNAYEIGSRTWASLIRVRFIRQKSQMRTNHGSRVIMMK